MYRHIFYQRHIIKVLIVILLLPVILAAESVTLSWQANVEPDLGGYKIYYGTSSLSYTGIIDVGNTIQYTVNNLNAGLTYYFALTAYDEDGNESGFSSELSTYVADSSPPRIVSVLCNQDDRVTIVFNEDIDKTSAEIATNYSINNGVVVQSAVRQSDKRTVILYTTQHNSGSYIVTVNNVLDAAYLSIAANTQWGYNWVEVDSVAPTVTGVEILNANYLAVTYSESVDQITAMTISNYVITPSVNISSISINPSYTTVYITTANHTPGTTYYLTVNNIQDGSGNSIAANTQKTYSLQSGDTDPPILIAARLNDDGTELEIEFNEGLNTTFAVNLNNYSITPAVTINGAVLSNNNTVVTLATQQHTSGNYTVTVSGVGDDAVPSNIMGSAQLSYSRSTDTTNPALTGASLSSDDVLELVFSEALSRSSAENKSNYSIAPSVSIVQAILDVSQVKVLLLTESHTEGNYRITVNNVKDLASNTIASNSYQDYSYIAPDKAAPQIVQVVLHGDNLLELVFDEALDRTSGENVSSYSISPSVAITEASLVGSELNRIYLSTGSHTAGQSYTIYVNGVMDRAPAPNITTAQHDYDYPLQDNTPPTLTSVILQGDQFLELTFSESVERESAEMPSNYSIQPQVNILAATLDVSGTKVFLQTENHPSDTQFTITVQNVKDRALTPNTIGAENVRMYATVSPDNIPPVLEMAEILGNTLVELIFSEPLDETTALEKNNYSINNGIQIQNISLNQTKKYVYLTTSVHQRGTYTVTVHNIKDLANNTITTGNEKDYTYVPVDTLPPILINVEAVNATTLDLLFNEPLNVTSAENIANYAISNNIVVERARLDVNMTGVILQTSVHEPGDYTIILNNIKDASSAGNVISVNTAKDYAYTPEDNVPPAILSAELQNEKKLVVTFTEPLESVSAQNESNYVVNNNISVLSVLAHTADRVVLETTEHAAGEYILTVNGLKDASESHNAIVPYSQKSYTWSPVDTTGPALISAELLATNYLELTFSEPIDGVESVKPENYEIDPEIGITAAILGSSLQKVGLVTENHTAGTYTITVHNIKDRAFTPNPITEQNSINYTYTPPDTTPPELVTVEMRASSMSIVLVFDEPLGRTSAENVANYQINPDIQITRADLLASLTEVVLETSSHQPNTQYTIRIQGLKDRAVIPNTIVNPIQYVYSYTPPDNVPPEIISVKLQGVNLLELAFSEQVDKTTAEDRENYQIISNIEVYDASLDETNKKVYLQTSDHLPGMNYQVSVENVKDRAPIPNVIEPNRWITYSMATSGGLSDNTAPQVARIDVVSLTQVHIYFTEPMDKATSENKANYSISDGVVVQSATLDTTLLKVRLNTSGHQSGKSYNIQVSNLVDRAAHPNLLQAAGPIKYLLSDGISLSKISRSEYDWKTFHVGEQAYVDRDYTIEQIPQYLEGAVQIMTCNDDKVSEGNAFVTFELLGEGTMYLAYDKQIGTLPSWMAGWKICGDQIVNSRSTVYQVYSKEVKAGKIILGGNGGSMDDNMYLGFIVPHFASRSAVANLSKTSYQTEHISVGDTYYIDRQYTIASIPEEMERFLWIKTANDDKESRDESFLSFTLSVKSNIYVAHDSRIASLPKWLDSWDLLEEKIVDSRSTTFDIYCKEFESGDVTLGGNCGSAEDNMYIVLIEPLDGFQAGPNTQVPGYFNLQQNYPNPFNPVTTIPYIVEKAGDIKITVFNVLGQTVKVLVDGFLDADTYQVEWDGRDVFGQRVSSGVYFYRIQQGQYAKTRRMLLLR